MGESKRHAQTMPPLCKGRCRRTAAEGLLHSKETTPQSANARMFFGFAREIVGVQPTKKNSARRIASRTAHPLHRGAESTHQPCRDRRPRRSSPTVAKTGRRGAMVPTKVTSVRLRAIRQSPLRDSGNCVHTAGHRLSPTAKKAPIRELFSSLHFISYFRFILRFSP